MGVTPGFRTTPPRLQRMLAHMASHRGHRQEQHHQRIDRAGQGLPAPPPQIPPLPDVRTRDIPFDDYHVAKCPRAEGVYEGGCSWSAIAPPTIAQYPLGTQARTTTLPFWAAISEKGFQKC